MTAGTKERSREAPSRTDADRRRRWREHHIEHERIAREWAARGYQHPPPKYPPLPHDLIGLACGARTRAGTPCKLTAIYSNGRCKLHGGLSTGPPSDEGRERCRQAARTRWAQVKASGTP